MAGQREFKNEFLDYDGETLLAPDGKIKPEIEKQLRTIVNRLLQREYTGLTSSSVDWSDYTVYTGSSGVALLHLHIFNKLDNDEKMLRKSLGYIEESLQHLKMKKVSFLGGDSGPLAIAAVLYHKLGQINDSQKCIQRLVARQKDVFEDKSMSDELLFGRSGYLYALLFVQNHISSNTIEAKLISSVVQRIVESGKKMALAEQLSTQLMYAWHGKKYLGAAHGLAGIFHTLLLACSSSQSLQQYVGDIRAGIDYLLTLRCPSGNYPSSIGSSTGDLLVHWCHGAPGFIHLFTTAYRMFQDERYLRAAEDCAEVLWTRGLLRKGYGLCHGVAGNAYGFLALFRLTGDQKYLYRAVKFAEWCYDYGARGCRVPDRPFSLFEGLAGTIYFLIDLLNPSEAKFPAFEL